jgi:hypothetical protein
MIYSFRIENKKLGKKLAFKFKFKSDEAFLSLKRGVVRHVVQQALDQGWLYKDLSPVYIKKIND